LILGVRVKIFSGDLLFWWRRIALGTLEVMQDKELVKDLRIALREVEEGRTRPLDELMRELNLEKEI